MQDESTLDLLAVLHYVLGALMALTASIFLIHVAMGTAMLLGGFENGDAPPRFMGWVFVILPGLVVLAGWTLSLLVITAGRRLKRREHHGFCMAVAAVECLFMPLGTALGVSTLVTLMKDPVRQAFQGIPSQYGDRRGV